MAAAPLTHHEIMRLAAPFVRRGRQVDLAASDRLARRLAFRAEAPGDEAALRVALHLEDGRKAAHRLVRRIELHGGLLAEAEVEGDDPAALLDRLDALPLAAQWRRGDGWWLAFGLRLDLQQPEAAPRLLRAELVVDALVLRLQVPGVGGIPAEASLEAPGHDIPELPDDLLAVLGGWSSLWRIGRQWRGSLRLPRREPARSLEAMQRLDAAATHLARTLAEPPSRFHERLAAERWRVALRRCLPLAAVLALVGASFAVTQLSLAQNSVVRMLIFNAPPILLAVGVCLQELPRFEWPRRPRPLEAAAWRRTAASAHEE